jgi:lysophospholipase L1-like esterase
MKRTEAIAVSVVLLSVSFGLLLCEGGSRLLLNPADYLSVTTVGDKVLGIAIAPHSPGFDAWGFRNPRVPSKADVVVVGDSHTYGNTATMNDAWPSVVGRATGLEVYNLGVGGYGPNQYYHLLTTKGLSLGPRWVVCGLYMGDDFENAFSVTYGLDAWASLRQGRRNTTDPNIWDSSEPAGFGSGARNWLSAHSVVYRLIVHGPLLATVKAKLRPEDPATTSIRVDERNIQEAFRPIGIAQRLNQADGRVQEGMRITFNLLRQMNEACRRHECRFLVVIIPTKETVFADYLERDLQLHLHDVVSRLLADERVARRRLVDFLDAHGIAYVDTLPALTHAVSDRLYARTTRDMHPGRNGYRVIGETVAAYLKQHAPRS